MLDATGPVTYKGPMPRSTIVALPTRATRGIGVEPGIRHIRMLPGAPRQPAGAAGDPQNSRLLGDAHRPLRVLIVDDDPAVATVLEDMVLEAGGESVGIITSALAAIGAAAVISPDVVLMDVRLPGAMDGIEAAGIIRARGSAAVVVITGAAADPDIRSRLKALDGIEVVFKPVLENELRAAILRAHAAR
jgi:CheY-like chemotaxis protein